MKTTASEPLQVRLVPRQRGEQVAVAGAQPPGERHAGNELRDVVELAIAEGPDVVLARPRADFYAAGKPGPDDVLLLIEVMDTSAETDRGVKLPLYARAGIPEVWLLDLATRRVEVFRQPSLSGYSEAHTVERDDRLVLQAFPDLSLTVADLLG